MAHTVTAATAQYDPKLRTYLYLNSLGILTVSVVGLAIIPLWVFVGWWWSKRHFETLSCILTDRAVVIKKGVFFRAEKTIPLDSIQDVSFHEGPLMRRLALSQIKIETAGQSAAQGSSEGTLVGLIGAEAFRDAILEQRDRITGHDATPRIDDTVSTHELLTEIRDSLRRIERQLATANGAVPQA